MMKKDMKSKVVAKEWLYGSLMVKILITKIQVNLVPLGLGTELSLKFLPLTYHHIHFLATTLDFTSVFTMAFLRAFLQLGCFGLDITSFCICTHQSGGFFNLSLFFITERRKRDKADFLILKLFLLLSVIIQILYYTFITCKFSAG